MGIAQRIGAWSAVSLFAIVAAGCPPEVAAPGSGMSAGLSDEACYSAGRRCNAPGQCCSNRCDFSRGTPGVCGGIDDLGGPLAALPSAQKSQDFRLNAPAVVASTASQSADGQTLMTVQFGGDRRLGPTLVLRTEDGSIVLHDDGTAGDPKAGDRSFNVALPLDFAHLKAQEAATIAVLRKQQITKVPVFDGPELIGVRDIDFEIDASHIRFFPPVALFDNARSLTVTDLGVVEDPARTFNPCAAPASAGTPLGKWTFGYLMTQMANQAVTGIDPSALVLDWLNAWSTTQVVNGYDIDRRQQVSDIIDGWPKVGGKLDLSRAPMKLLAIVNRADLAGNTSYGSVGGAEGRFVFGVLTPTCQTRPFTVIVEYGVPRRTCTGLRDWAVAWKNLSTMTVGSAAYNAALEALTEVFAHANADPTKLAGSALDQLRTDENALHAVGAEQPQWELREFTLQIGAGGTRLREATVKQTPDELFNAERDGDRSGDLATWVNGNESALLAGTATIPLVLPFAPGDHFLGGSTLNFFTLINGQHHRDFWTAPGITNNDARHKLSLNTCNGCHGEETRTGFEHVGPANFGTAAGLSAFLTGETIPDPVDATKMRSFNELSSRAVRLEQMATSTCGKLQLVKDSNVQVSPLPPLAFRPRLATH